VVRDPPHEIAFGVIGRFWAGEMVLASIDAAISRRSGAQIRRGRSYEDLAKGSPSEPWT